MPYTIRGRVLDQKGDPIVGANVYVRLADTTIRDPYADRFDSLGFSSIQATPLIDQPLTISGVTSTGENITTTQIQNDEAFTTSTSGTQTLATTTTDNEGNFDIQSVWGGFTAPRTPSPTAAPNSWFNLLYLEITDRNNNLIEIIRNPRPTNYEIIQNNTEIDVNFGGSINLTNYYPIGVYRVGSFLDRDILAISQEFKAISKFIKIHTDLMNNYPALTDVEKANLFQININVTVPNTTFLDNDLGYPTGSGGAGPSPTLGMRPVALTWGRSIANDLVSSLVFELDKYYHLNERSSEIRYESTPFDGVIYPKQVSQAFEQRINSKPFQYLFDNRRIFNGPNIIDDNFSSTPSGFENKEGPIFNPVHPIVKSIINNSFSRGSFIRSRVSLGATFNVTIDVLTRNPRLICGKSKEGKTKFKNIITDNPKTFVTFTRPESLTNKPSANFLNINPLAIPDRYRIITTAPNPSGTSETSTDFFNYTVDALGNTTRVDGSTPSPSPIVSNFSDDYYRNDDGKSGDLLAWGFVAWLSLIMDQTDFLQKDWLPRAQLFNQDPQYITPSTILADGAWFRGLALTDFTFEGTPGSRYPIIDGSPPAPGTTGTSVDPTGTLTTWNEINNGFYIPRSSSAHLTTRLQAACLDNPGSGPIYRRINGVDEPIDHIREHIRRYVRFVTDAPGDLRRRPGLWIPQASFIRQEITGYTVGGIDFPPLLKINDDTNYSWVARAVAYAGPISLNVVSQAVNVPLFYPQINSSGQVITNSPSPPSVSKISIQSNTGAAYSYTGVPSTGFSTTTTPTSTMLGIYGQLPSGYNIDFCDRPEYLPTDNINKIVTFESGI